MNLPGDSIAVSVSLSPFKSRILVRSQSFNISGIARSPAASVHGLNFHTLDLNEQCEGKMPRLSLQWRFEALILFSE